MVLVLLGTKRTLCKDHGEYLTTYACNGEVLKIQCKENCVIRLIRANYGRFSMAVCNDKSNTDWSANCRSHRSFPILHGLCGSKQSCSVTANVSLFDDPCPGTEKYLEAYYACVSAISSSQQVETIATSTSEIPPSKEKDFEKIHWADSNATLFSISNATDGQVFNTTNIQKQPMCKATVIRNLTWPWVSAGDVSMLPCPPGATGFAQWHCLMTSNNEAAYFPSTPDLSQCRSMWLTSLQSRINEESPLKIAAELSKNTGGKIFGGDLVMSIKIIRSLALKMQTNIQTFSLYQQKEVVANDQLASIAQVSNNLLDVSHHWKDLSYKEQVQMASSLLIGLEENSFLLAETIRRQKVVTHCLKNILLSVQVLEIDNVHDELFPSSSLLDSCSLKVESWLQLNKSSLLENSDTGLIRLVYVAFDTLQKVFNDSEKKIINSKVLSASLGKGRHIQLTHPVTLCLKHLQLKNVSNPSCVFWDYTQTQWSTEGCSLIKTNLTHTTCQCSYLSSFALMVDV